MIGSNRFPLNTDGIQVLLQAASPDWVKNLDNALQQIQTDFRKEDQAGYSFLVERLRAWTWCHQVPKEHRDYVSIERLAAIAQRVRKEAKVFITVGIGGSDLGTRTLHDLLNHPYHNQMVAAGKTAGIPEIYFTGDTFDPLRLRALLEMLKARDLLNHTVLNIVSKSGKTAESALMGMILADAIGPNWMSRTIATTGLNEKSLLYQMQNPSRKQEFMDVLPVPDGVGGRFSFASPVGLLLLAITAPTDPAARLREAFQGYSEAHKAFLDDPPEQNPAFQLAKILHIAETYCGKTSLVFYPYFDNKTLGDWFVQLYEESVQERGSGLNILTTSGPTGNHSLLNGIVMGARDKLILFLAPEDFGDAMQVPPQAPLSGDLKMYQGITLAKAQNASLLGTYKDFVDRSIPCMIQQFPTRDARSLFALMRILMDMVAVKGRLQSLHIDPFTGEHKIRNEETYTQDGVEGYKKRMRENLHR